MREDRPRPVKELAAVWQTTKGLPGWLSPAKREAKSRFADWLRRTNGETVDPDSIFDVRSSASTEYKRQLLNGLRIVVLYNRLRENPNLNLARGPSFFSGKAAPAYHLAKVIIKFINNLAIPSMAIRRCAAGSRSSSYPTTAFPSPNG